MARLVPKIIAHPAPWRRRSEISIITSGENVTRNEARVNMEIPQRKIRFLPKISASFPNGTRRMAMERRYAVVIQERVTASSENSSPIEGSAIFTDEPSKGVMKLLIIAMKRITRFIVGVNDMRLPAVIEIHSIWYSDNHPVIIHSIYS
jgi:hypothetical protein